MGEWSENSKVRTQQLHHATLAFFVVIRKTRAHYWGQVVDARNGGGDTYPTLCLIPSILRKNAFHLFGIDSASGRAYFVLARVCVSVSPAMTMLMLWAVFDVGAAAQRIRIYGHVCAHTLAHTHTRNPSNRPTIWRVPKKSCSSVGRQSVPIFGRWRRTGSANSANATRAYSSQTRCDNNASEMMTFFQCMLRAVLRRQQIADFKRTHTRTHSVSVRVFFKLAISSLRPRSAHEF